MSVPDAYAADLAALAWLVELGADEAVAETPVDRFALAEAPP
ncbi:uracil-DNA glycosylase, partial [Amaricoccus sp. HAR-UPW-R2A-40]